MATDNTKSLKQLLDEKQPITKYSEDLSTNINYTLVDNEEKVFKAENISHLKLIVPDNIKQGFICIVSFKCGEATTWEIAPESMSIKYIFDGLQVENLPALLPGYYYSCGFIYDGLNLCLYIKELS